MVKLGDAIRAKGFDPALLYPPPSEWRLSDEERDAELDRLYEELTVAGR